MRLKSDFCRFKGDNDSFKIQSMAYI